VCFHYYLGVSVVRDKSWPKRARWLWRRIKEVLPLRVAAGIDAKRERPDSGTVITLRKVPTNDVSNASTSEPRSDNGKAAGNKEGSNGSSNASSLSNASPNASEEPARQAGSGNTGITNIRNGDSSEEVSAFLANPPARYTRQAGECERKGAPERLLKSLASDAAYEVFGNTNRRSEVLPRLEAALREKRVERSQAD
jgi:hypothetical protein